MQVNVEIKGGGCEEKLVELIKKYKMESSVIVSSFNHGYLKKVRELYSGIAVGALVKDAEDLSVFTGAFKPEALHPRYNKVDKAFVKQAHAAGMKVNVYTVNDPVAMRQMASAGVDGIITNFPDMLLKILKPGKKKAESGKLDG